MKYIRIWKSFNMILFLMILVFFLTTCANMFKNMMDSDYKDYGVYDSTVSSDQLCELRFVGVNIRTFNGRNVNWNNGHIKVPAGRHEIGVAVTLHNEKELREQIEEAKRSYGLSSFGRQVEFILDILEDPQNNKIFSVNFIPEHNYLFSYNSKVGYFFWDMTNLKSEFYGDTIAKAARKKNTPTALEGTWIGSDNTIFQFTGNTWEATLPVTYILNVDNWEGKWKGTFEMSNNKIILYKTHVYTLWWTKIKTWKETLIFSYSFENENLVLELEGIIPQIKFTKK